MVDNQNPLQTLYNSLKRDNYDVPDNYESFERTLTEDTNARRTLYNSLMRDNYDVPDSYESFDRTLFGSDDSGTAAPQQPSRPAGARPTAPWRETSPMPADVAAKFDADESRKSSASIPQSITMSSKTDAEEPAADAQPLGPERFAKQMQMEQQLGQMSQDFTNRMEAIRKGNQPFGSGHQREFNPETGKMEDVYYTKAGERTNTPLAQWEENNKALRLQQDIDQSLSALDGAAEAAWKTATEASGKEQSENIKMIARTGGFMPGGSGMGQLAMLNTASHLKYHDLQRMADDAWNSLGIVKQQAMIDGIYNTLRSHHYNDGASDEQLRAEAEAMARQENDRRLFEYAVKMNAPKDATDYFFRKALQNNAITMLKDFAARSMAGTTGDWEARDVAEQQYDKESLGHNLIGHAGGITGFLLDPTVLIGGAAAKGAVGGATKIAGKLAAKRGGAAWVAEKAPTLIGKTTTGVVAGAGNFGTYESAQEALRQLRWGGMIEIDEKTGRYKIDGYDLGEVAKKFGHGALMGGTIGVLGPLTGNVGDRLVGYINKTGKPGTVANIMDKLGARTVQTGVCKTAEGTIFSIPEWIDTYKKYGEMIDALSDPESKNYIADDFQRAKKIEELKAERAAEVMDTWTENEKMMLGFGLQHMVKSIPQRISEMRDIDNARTMEERNHNRRDWLSKLNKMLDGRPDLALTRDEKDELQRRGYTDLADLVSEYKRWEEEKAATEKARPDAIDASRMIGEGEDAAIPYNRFLQLMEDPTVSEAARAKMYYYLTGRQAPMSTIMGWSPIEEVKDANGKVTGYNVKSLGAKGVITSRTFADRAAAEAELQKIYRQAELNTLDIGERYYDGRGLSSADLRDYVGKQHGVDVDASIRKDPNRRSKAEQEAVDDYTKRLYVGVKTEEAYQSGYEADEQGRQDAMMELAMSDPSDPDRAEKQAAVDGINQRINDDADMQVAQQREAYNLQRNDDDGSVHPATMTVDGQEREVFIKSGLVTTGADGSIDVENSGETIVVYDPVEGKNKMVSPADIRNLGEVTTAEQFESDLQNRRAAFVEQQQDAATGRFNPQPGQEIEIPDAGTAVVLVTDGETVTLQMPDGTQQSMAIADIQQIADGVMMEDYRQRHPDTAAPEQPTAEAPAMIEGKPQSFEPNMELTIKDGNTEKTVYVTGTRARWEAGKFVEDPDGKFVELYDPEANGGNGGMTYIRDDDPDGKIVGYKPAPLEEQPAEPQDEEPSREYRPEWIDRKNPPDDGGTPPPPPPPAAAPALEGEKTFGEQMEEEQGPKVQTPETFTPDTYLPESKVTQPAPDRDAMPMRQVKRKVDGKMTTVEEEDWMATTPSRAYQYLYEEAVTLGLPVETADNLVQANLKAAQKDVERAKKAVGSVVSVLQKQNAAQAAVDYWQQVQSMRQAAVDAEQAEAAKNVPEEEPLPVALQQTIDRAKGNAKTLLAEAAEEMKNDPGALVLLEDMSPYTLEELIPDLLLGNSKHSPKLMFNDEVIDGRTVKGFSSMSGYSWKDVRQLPGIWAKRANGGMSMEQFGELIEQAARENSVPFDENDATAGLNAALAFFGEVKTLGDMYDYTVKRRIERAEDYHAAALSRAEDDWIAGHDGLTRAEYEEWEHSMEEKAAALNGKKYDEYYNKLAESTLNSHDYTKSETDDGRGPEAGTGTLQGPEVLQTTDTRDGSRGVEGSGSRDESGTAEPATPDNGVAVTEQPTPEEEALASRIEVNYDGETTEGGPNGTIYRRPIVIDGIHRVEQVNEPDEKGHYTGSYYMYDGKRYADLPDVFSFIDSNPAPKEDASITPTQYTTKKGKVLDMQLVKFDKELTKEQFEAAKEIARKSMGWWSVADGGFLMRSKDAARNLVDSMSDKETVADEQPVSLTDMNTVALNEPVEKTTASPLEKTYTRFKEKYPDRTPLIRVGDFYETFGEDAKQVAKILETPLTKNGSTGFPYHALNQYLPRLIRAGKTVSIVDNASSDNDAEPTETVVPRADSNKKADTQAEEDTYGANNQFVSRERYEELKKRMREKLNRMNVGIDPELLALGSEMAVFHLEAGARKFVDFAKRMIADMGDAIRPYLKAFYNAGRDMPEMESRRDEFTPHDEVSRFDVINFDKEGPKDIIEMAKNVVKEQELSQQAEQAKSEIKTKRNEQRKENKQGKKKAKPTAAAQSTLDFPKDYRDYMTPEAKEQYAKDPRSKAFAHPELFYIFAASQDGVNIPYEVLSKLPEVIAAEQAVRDTQAGGYLKLTDEQIDTYAERLLNNENGSVVIDENGKVHRTGEIKKESKAFIVIGRPAAGKSEVFAEPLSQENKARIIDSDDVKPWLEGYNNGDGADYVHKASGEVAERATIMAALRGENIVIPKLGQSESYIDLAVALRLAGYDVQLYFNDLPEDTSITRAMSRYAKTGRFLSLDFLRKINGNISRIFSTFAQNSLKDYFYERASQKVQNLRKGFGFLLDSNGEARERLRQLSTALGGGNQGEYGTVQGNVGDGKLQTTGNKLVVISPDEPIFSHIEWKSNDVRLGEKPKEIWNSASGEPMPNAKPQSNDRTRNDQGGEPEGNAADMGEDGTRPDGGQQAGTPATPAEGGEAGGMADADAEGESRDADRTVPARVQRPGSGRDSSSRPAGGVSAGNVLVDPTVEHGDTRTDNGSDLTPKEKNTPLNTRNYLYPANASAIDDMPPMERMKTNVAALEVLRTLLREGRDATPAERATMGKLRGWGGINVPNTYEAKYRKYDLTPLQKQLVEIVDELDPDGKKGLLESLNTAALTSYYTPIPIAQAMHSVAEMAGYKGGGTMLDPSMGNGVFEGTMKKGVQQSTQIRGCELDWLTGQIAKRLYPDARVNVSGFQDAHVPENYYDYVVSNIPFGSLQVTDLEWEKNPSPIRKAAQGKIHNYFAVKMVESTRPGGLCVIMTSNAIMDTQGNAPIRKYIADNCEILGAVRLPNNTFKGAGTRVVTDVIYLRKFRDESDRLTILDNGDYNDKVLTPFLTVSGKKMADRIGSIKEVKYNSYFQVNPQNVVGEIMASGQYSDDAFDLRSEYSTDELAKQFTKLGKKFIDQRKKRFGDTIYGTTVKRPQIAEAVRETYKGNGNYEGQGNIIVQDGKIGRLESVKEGSGKRLEFVEQPIPGATTQQVQDYVSLRSLLKELIAAQIEGRPEAETTEIRERMQAAYKNYTNQHGQLLNKKNAFIADDIDGFQVRALEKWKDGKFQGMADIYTKNTISARHDINTVGTPQDAVLNSLSEYGYINNEYMERVLGPKWSEDCGDLVFEDPSMPGDYIMKDSYLSGDVVSKLEQAQKMAAEDSRWQRNVDALQAVQPKRKEFGQFPCHMGARWVPVDVYNDFLKYVFDIHEGWRGTRNGIVYDESTCSYLFNFDESQFGGKSSEYRTNKKKASEIFEAALLDKDITIRLKDDEGKDIGIDQEATDAARAKVEQLREEFENWVVRDKDRVQLLTDTYNNIFNRHVLPTYNGSHLHVAGLQGKELRPHQKDAVWRIINQRGGIIDHAVGAGKSLVMMSSIMEMRRMGIAKKPMIVALKSTTAQIANEFRTTFPAARVLAPSEKDFSTQNRKKFLAQIAVNDYDCVILSHEQYSQLDHSDDIKRSFITDQVDQIDNLVEYLYGKDDQSQLTKKQIKGLQKRKENLMEKLKKLDLIKTDQEFVFENLGVDYLFVDECQAFKNLMFQTSYSRIAGLGNPEGSERSTKMLYGIRALQEMHQGDMGTVFLSGTTISNSLSELYNIFNYLRPNEMRRMGLNTFDAWASTFAVRSTEAEFGVTNELKEKSRFRKFEGLQELSRLYTEIADVRNDSNLVLPKPKAKTHFVAIPISDTMKEINAAIVDMVQTQNGSYFGITDVVKDKYPWSLAATNLAKKATLSPKLIDEMYDDENGKITHVCENVKKIYDKFNDQKGTQLIFCDSGVPGAGKTYDAYSDIINRLTEQYGIPRNEIADIHAAKTDEQRADLFKKVKDGTIRILIGGTKNMGTGVNVQNRVVAMHHLDIPWTPADVNQRNGRGSRQGNTVARDFNNNEVDVYYYAVEQTLDTYRYQLQDVKGKMIDAFKTANVGVDEFDEGGDAGDEGGAMNAAEMVAILSGNPVILDKAKQDKLVEKLNRLKRTQMMEHANRQEEYRRLQQEKSRVERLIDYNKQDIERLKRNGFAPDKEGKWPPLKVTVDGKVYDKAKEAGEAIHKAITKKGTFDISSYGIPAKMTVEEKQSSLFGTSGIERKLVADTDTGILYTVNLSDDATAAGQSMQNLLKNIYHYADAYAARLEEINHKLDGAEVGEFVFAKQAELDEAIERKREIDAEYNKLVVSDRRPSAPAESEAPDDGVRFRIREGAAPNEANTQQNEQAKRQVVEQLAEKLGTDIYIINNVDDIQHNDPEVLALMKVNPGWYDPKTGKVYVVLPNNRSREDAMATVFHETAGHKGMRDMVGEENYDTFLDTVYGALKDELRSDIDHRTYEAFMNDVFKRSGESKRTYEQHRREQVDELIGRLSETMPEDMTAKERTLWQRVCDLVRRAIDKFLGTLKLPSWVKLGENEIRYMIWRSRERLENQGIVGKAKDYDKRHKLGLDRPSFRSADETADILNDQSLGMQERMTAMATKIAALHADDAAAKNRAYRAIGGNLADLRKAMSLQKEFDRSTVKRVADLARVLLSGGYLDNLSRYEVGRLLSAVKNATGRSDIRPDIKKVMDIMVDNQLKRAEDLLHQLETIKTKKVNAKGVEVIGELDIAGQQIVEAFKKGRKLEKEGIEQQIADAQQRMGSDNKTIADEAANEYAGLQFALEYAQNVKESEAEEQELRDELERARLEARNPEGVFADKEAYDQYRASVEEALRQNRVERLQAYLDLAGRLSGNLSQSIANAMEFKEAEKERIADIQHNANSDMEGRPSNEHYTPDFKDKFVNNSFVQFLFSPLATFDQMLRLFGSKSANGEGYLYNRFMRGWVDARQKEISGVRQKYAMLDDKVHQLFGNEAKNTAQLIRRIGSMPKMTVQFWNGGAMRDHTLTQGNLMYIYMADKMTDGRMKLRSMGVKEEDIDKVTAALDPRLKELADWLQDYFLVETRNEYNETHKRLFGASMAAIENYFPLKILANARADKPEDLDNPKQTEGISTSTGSIIKRRRNALALDILGADAINVVLDHIAQMEHWNAFAEFNRDLNTLRTYKRFRNQVYNMTTIYGSGKKLWDRFIDVSQMAAGTYRPKRADLDVAATNVAKGVTAAKVSFRIFTALKQFLSFPAYFPEARPDLLAANLATPWKAWSWAMENMPIFQERWKSRIAGDPRLMKSELDWKGWRNNVVQMASRIGMSPNAFVDALTVSIGAHSIYQSRKARYLKEGYSDEQADRRAIQDAEIAYNQTQQSSEGAFTSTMQVDRSWLSVMFTVFRNASMAYQRQLHDALRNLKRDLFEKGNREQSIEFMAKQMTRDGVPEDKAQEAAKARYNRQIGKDMLRVATFGYILQLAWNLGAKLPYLLFGDDKKREMMDDVWAQSMFGSVEGLTGGDVYSQAGKMLVQGEGNPEYLKKEMPLTSDAYKVLQEIGNGKYGEVVNDAVNLAVQVGIGVNPQSITDAVLAIMDACGDDPALAHEAIIAVMRILQVPQSQIKEMYFDEVGLSGSEVSNYTPQQLVERYARYQVKRGRLLAPWTWDDKALLGKEEKKAAKTVKERVEKVGAEYDEALADYEARYNEVKERIDTAYEAAKQERDYVKKAQIIAEVRRADEKAFELYDDYKKYDKQLDDIVAKYLAAETPDQAALAKDDLLGFKSRMVELLGTADEKQRRKLRFQLDEYYRDFLKEYAEMKDQ